MDPRDENGYATRPISYYRKWRHQPDIQVADDGGRMVVCSSCSLFQINGVWCQENGVLCADIIVRSKEPVQWKQVFREYEEHMPYFLLLRPIDQLSNRELRIRIRHDSVNEWWLEDMVGFWHGVGIVGGKLYETRRMVWSITGSVLDVICVFNQIAHRVQYFHRVFQQIYLKT